MNELGRRKPSPSVFGFPIVIKVGEFFFRPGSGFSFSFSSLFNLLLHPGSGPEAADSHSFGVRHQHPLFRLPFSDT